MGDVDTMSMKELKELIASAGLSLAGCIEKPDIRQRAREAQAALAAKAGRAIGKAARESMSDGDAAAVANSFTTAAEALQHATVPARVSELVMLRAQIKANDEKLFAAQMLIDHQIKTNDAAQILIDAQSSLCRK